MKITSPGLYDLPIADYHGQPCDGPSFSKSALQTILTECPAMYWAFSPLNPDRYPEPDETPAQREGRMIGAYILGDKAFSVEFVTSPYDNFRTKEARMWREEQARTVVTEADLDKARAMKAALMANPDVAYIFDTDHLVEQTVAWKEQHTGCGLWCLARPDLTPVDASLLIRDYKRPHSVHPDKLQYWWDDFGGDMQAAMALDGWKAVTGETRPGFANICQMPKPPYLAAEMVYTPEQIKRGRYRYLAALEIAARCLESGHWPHYPSPAHYANPRRIEEELEELRDAPQQPRSPGSREETDTARLRAAG